MGDFAILLNTTSESSESTSDFESFEGFLVGVFNFFFGDFEGDL